VYWSCLYLYLFLSSTSLFSRHLLCSTILLRISGFNYLAIFYCTGNYNDCSTDIRRSSLALWIVPIISYASQLLHDFLLQWMYGVFSAPSHTYYTTKLLSAHIVIHFASKSLIVSMQLWLLRQCIQYKCICASIHYMH